MNQALTIKKIFLTSAKVDLLTVIIHLYLYYKCSIYDTTEGIHASIEAFTSTIHVKILNDLFVVTANIPYTT